MEHVLQRTLWQVYTCGVCGWEGDHDEVVEHMHRHTKAEVAQMYRTGRWIAR